MRAKQGKREKKESLPVEQLLNRVTAFGSIMFRD